MLQLLLFLSKLRPFLAEAIFCPDKCVMVPIQLVQGIVEFMFTAHTAAPTSTSLQLILHCLRRSAELIQKTNTTRVQFQVCLLAD